ncbi:hypothetical protein DFH08DRAFT_805927 [Mycena albidolilacea]|uniref:Uncharacterized protein n=1 Tax=Mycena albidolilacea TaxID=1033008 RepID=A0AAD7A864_9AGAR|nr:hypothetical protein DFH08DRAFT_805927 [Mycena albidolilacea]
MGNEDHKLSESTVKAIGGACTAAGNTMPTAFGTHTTLVGPVVLRNQFLRVKYFKHFLELAKIFEDCLKLTIDADYVDNELWEQIAAWVLTYKKIYYQYNLARLSTCTLTVHALLHIPDNILNGGPVWCYWNYITE